MVAPFNYMLPEYSNPRTAICFPQHYKSKNSKDFFVTTGSPRRGAGSNCILKIGEHTKQTLTKI